MKRIGNIFNRIIDFNNLVLADKKARLNKSKRYGIAKFDKHSHENLLKLQRMFIEGTYKTSEYDIYTIIADRTWFKDKINSSKDLISHFSLHVVFKISFKYIQLY